MGSGGAFWGNKENFFLHLETGTMASLYFLLRASRTSRQDEAGETEMVEDRKLQKRKKKRREPESSSCYSDSESSGTIFFFFFFFVFDISDFLGGSFLIVVFFNSSFISEFLLLND